MQAASKAVNSPLLEASMDGARGVLLCIAGSSDLGLFEINEAASLVQEAAHPEANIIFGTVIDDSLGDEVRVTVIAAGFESATPTQKELEPPASGPRSSSARAEPHPAGQPADPLERPVIGLCQLEDHNCAGRAGFQKSACALSPAMIGVLRPRSLTPPTQWATSASR